MRLHNRLPIPRSRSSPRRRCQGLLAGRAKRRLNDLLARRAITVAPILIALLESPERQPASVVAISATDGDLPEYARAVEAAGGLPRLLRFDVDALDEQLAGCSGVLLSGGGDINPRFYGLSTGLAEDLEGDRRDNFEIELVRRARAQRLPTLCICRGLEIANVAFGGTLVTDIGAAKGAEAAALHRLHADGKAVRGLIAGHVVAVEPDSLLATIVPQTSLLTGSRHHQSLASVAPDLRVVAATPDGVIEAAEARFESPFWLGVQWHPESTIRLDDGASLAIYEAFVVAATRFARSGAA